MLAAIAKVRKENDHELDPALETRIRTLFPQLELTIDDDDLVSIASDLFYCAPDLAIELVNRQSNAPDKNTALDWSLLSLQVQAHTSDAHSRHHAASLSLKIKDPVARRLSTAATLIFGRMSAAQAIEEARKLDGLADQLYVLQHWMLANRERSDASEVLEFALAKALETQAYTPTATVYRELASCLPYIPDIQKASYFLSRIDSQRAELARRGPPDEFVRLQLLLARASWRHDRVAAEARFQDVYNTINGLADLETRTAAFARLLSAAVRADPEHQMEANTGLHTLAEREVEDGVARILVSSAQHFEVLRGTIEAAALGKPSLALQIVRQINTEWRRDQAYEAVVRSICSVPTIEWDVPSLDQALAGIVEPKRAHNALATVSDTLAQRTIPLSRLQDLTPVISRLLTTSDISARITFATNLLTALISLPDDVTRDLEERCVDEVKTHWPRLQNDWEKLALGYDVIARAAKAAPELAQSLVRHINAVKEQVGVVDHENAVAAGLGLRLAVRAFAGLLKRNLDTESDLDRLLRIIADVGSLAMQTFLLSDLIQRCFIHDRKDRCTELTEKHLLPLLNAIPSEDAWLKE